MRGEVMGDKEWTGVRPRVIPYSLGFLLLGVATYLIQIPPYVGIFTMLLLAPAWPMLCIYATAIGVLAESASGKVSKWWLLLPFVPFATYEAMAVREHLQVRTLAHDIRTSNASAVLTFDPTRSTLVFEGSGADRAARDIVANTTIPTAYAEGDAIRTIAKADCADIRAIMPSATTSGIQDMGMHRNAELDERACSVRTEDSPTLPITHVKTSILFGPNQGEYRTTTRITAPSGSGTTISGGMARPLSLIPFLVAGCALDSATPRWKCFASMTRSRVKLAQTAIYQDVDASEIARVLDLEWTGRTGRRIPSDPGFSAKIPALATKTTSQATDTANAVMSGSAGRIEAHDLTGLALNSRNLPETSRTLVDWSARTLGPGRTERPEGRCRRDEDQSTPICLHATRIANAKVVITALHSMKSKLPDDVAATVSDLKISESARSDEMRRTRSRNGIERKREKDRVRSMPNQRIMERMRVAEDRKSKIKEIRRRRIEESKSISMR